VEDPDFIMMTQYNEGVKALRARIADLEAAARCHTCGKAATCIGAYEGNTAQEFGCDVCCGHGNEDGHCQALDAKGDGAMPSEQRPPSS